MLAAADSVRRRAHPVAPGLTLAADRMPRLTSRMPTTLLIARHGQTDLNVDDRWQGRLDLKLNAVGLAQARALAERLPLRLDATVASR